MSRNQVILIVACIATIVALYIWSPTKKKVEEAPEVQSNNLITNSSQSVIEQSETFLNTLEGGNKDSILAFTSQLKSAENAKQRVELHSKIANAWVKEVQPGYAAYHLQQVAEILQTDSAYAAAGNVFVDAAKMSRDSTLNRQWYKNAINCYESATNIAPNNIEHQIKLSLCYVEGTKQPMVGVSNLLGLVKEHPNNPRVNLELGRLSILSGQFTKALPRLEKVLQQDTLQAETLFLLGETYNGLGQKDKAIEAFSKCRELVDNPAFRQEIDIYINKIKNN